MDKTRNFDEITLDLCKQNNAGFSDVEWRALAVAQCIIDTIPPEMRRQVLDSCCKEMED